jgi:hypothetical protein
MHAVDPIERRGDGSRLAWPKRSGLDFQVLSTVPLHGPRSIFDLRPGDRVALLLRWGGAAGREGREPDALLRATVDIWNRWVGHIRYEGPQAALVRRSAITIKLLDHFENGALSTTSTGRSSPVPTSGPTTTGASTGHCGLGYGSLSIRPGGGIWEVRTAGRVFTYSRRSVRWRSTEGRG